MRKVVRRPYLERIRHGDRIFGRLSAHDFIVSVGILYCTLHCLRNIAHHIRAFKSIQSLCL